MHTSISAKTADASPIDVDALAEELLRASGRARDTDPLCLAVALGLDPLPCPPRSSPEWDHSSPTRAAFEVGPREAASIRRGIARAVLLRRGVEHTIADVAALARRLEP